MRSFKQKLKIFGQKLKRPEDENHELKLQNKYLADCALRLDHDAELVTRLVTRLVFELGGQIELDYCNDIHEQWGLTSSFDEVNRTLKLRLVEMDKAIKVQEPKGEDR